MCSNLVRSTVSNFIRSRILLSGPIPVSDYMRLALTAQPIRKDLTKQDLDSGGYYMKKDVFGQQGDFITSPEISQLFGEMLAVWGLQTWMQIGGPKKFSIVELGPGRGTLSKDILRVFKQFKHITGTDVSLHLVEISPFLATVQCTSLTCPTNAQEINKLSASAKNLENPVMMGKEKLKKVESMELLLDPLKESQQSGGDAFYHHATAAESGFPVYWYRDVKDLPQDFHFYIAHEFFDALPIHKLQKVDNQWREVLVDVNPEQDTAFRLVISRNETPVIKLLQQKYSSILEDSRQHIEVSLDEIEILDNLTSRLDSCGGFANIIDYGHDGTKGDTLRAFYKHKLHDPLVDPGKADLTADVDFSIIKKLFGNRAMICGPTTQHDYFSKIGIEQRLKMLVSNSKLTEEERQNLISGYKMIMEEMGTRFKVMSLFPKILQSCMPDFVPIGFSR